MAPGLHPENCDDGVGARVDLQPGEQPAGRALATDVTAVYEDGGTVLVHGHPFDV
ncbi:hypothetical protein [Streptomyces sp. NPDC060198]|uniref:hypothetical protein n=1 Tax=Streptomyces sp. NPDC060198 TaxID=3347070 RepID=UPI00364B7037